MTDTDSTTIAVAGESPYEITVGRGVLAALADRLPPAARKVLVVHPPTLAAQAERLRATLTGEREVLLAEIPDAEQGKRIEVAAFCWQVMGQADFTRSDAVVGFGGGAVTDLAGFVAATWLRGIEVVQVPTTVLAMVDAAVGGKTGVNTAEGKNLVGAFWPPRAVLCDLDLLDSLSPNERVAGFAEVVKAGFIWAPEILELIEADPAAAVDPATPAFRRCIELAIEMKARVVGEDLREAGLRGGHGVRRRALAARRPPVGCRRAAPPRHPRAPRAADGLSRRRMAPAAGDDAARQEEPRRDAALHRARRHRPAHRAAGPGREPAVRRLPGGRRMTTPRRLLLVNGPNLNLLGIREPDVYGTSTLADVERIAGDAAAAHGFEVRAVQSTHVGVLIDAIHAAREDCAGIVINPGGLTHTSVVLRDALSGVALPVAEVHISDVRAREDFRQVSYVADVAVVHVVGEGVAGYATAVDLLIRVIAGVADG
jgi:3-dehydroquinate dehydratase type II